MSHWRTSFWMASAAVTAILIGTVGCEGPANSTSAAKNPNDPELFQIPQEQMSHVQVLKVQPTTLSRTLRLTGAAFARHR
jgi:hypothetical protein